MAKKKVNTPSSAKDINLYKVADYAPQTTKGKEKALQYMENLSNAKTFKFNAEQAAITRQFNKFEAEAARAWQTEMSNTAHQREVTDLKASGLNPVLSANTGAQSYTTTAASAANASGKADSAANAVSGYAQSVLSSGATRFAAQQSAAAMRYAAEQSAWATKYAADMNYKNSQEQRSHDTWVKQWQSGENLKERESQERMNTYKSDRTAYGYLMKVTEVVGNKLDQGFSGASKLFNDINNSSIPKLIGNSIGNIINKQSSMAKSFYNAAIDVLDKLGIDKTEYNQKQMIYAFSGNKSAQNYIKSKSKGRKSRSGKF